jgi:hypothetical protein
MACQNDGQELLDVTDLRRNPTANELLRLYDISPEIWKILFRKNGIVRGFSPGLGH